MGFDVSLNYLPSGLGSHCIQEQTSEVIRFCVFFPTIHTNSLTSATWIRSPATMDEVRGIFIAIVMDE